MGRVGQVRANVHRLFRPSLKIFAKRKFSWSLGPGKNSAKAEFFPDSRLIPALAEALRASWSLGPGNSTGKARRISNYLNIPALAEKFRKSEIFLDRSGRRIFQQSWKILAQDLRSWAYLIQFEDSSAPRWPASLALVARGGFFPR